MVIVEHFLGNREIAVCYAMNTNYISIDAIDGGMLEISKTQYVKIENWHPSILQGQPIQFSTAEGGSNAHIKFKLSLQMDNVKLMEYIYILNFGRIVPLLDMRNGKNFQEIRPLKSGAWRFLSDGTATVHIRFTTLTKKSPYYIIFGLVDRMTLDPIPGVHSMAIPVEVVSKYKETYQLKKGKESKKRQCNSHENITDAESRRITNAKYLTSTIRTQGIDIDAAFGDLSDDCTWESLTHNEMELVYEVLAENEGTENAVTPSNNCSELTYLCEREEDYIIDFWSWAINEYQFDFETLYV